MSDIVERLRDINRNPPNLADRRAIADEIERLRTLLVYQTDQADHYREAHRTACDGGELLHLEIERLTAQLAEAERLLDSGMIRFTERNELGEIVVRVYARVDLRRCIAEAIDAAMQERQP